MSDHVEKIVASSVIMLVTKSLPHLGRSFSWLDRSGARRAEFPSQAAAPGPEPGTVSRAGASHASFQVSWETRLFTLCRGRARSGGSEQLNNIENLNKMFMRLLTRDTHVTITRALISAQGCCVALAFCKDFCTIKLPFYMMRLGKWHIFNLIVLIHEQTKINILILENTCLLNQT